MINKKEFRFGNLMQDREGRLCKVELISVDEFKAPAMVGGITALPVKPIPLTEEWLVKFGYEDKNKFDFFGNFGLLPQNGFYYLSQSDENGIAIFIKNKIEYAHQLQNLYFALTGEELKLTEV